MPLTPLALLTLAGLATAAPAKSATGLPANTQSCKATQNVIAPDGGWAALWYEVEIGTPWSEATCKELTQVVCSETVWEWYDLVDTNWKDNCKKTKAGQIKFQFGSGTYGHGARINWALHEVLPLIGFNCPNH